MTSVAPDGLHWTREGERGRDVHPTGLYTAKAQHQRALMAARWDSRWAEAYPMASLRVRPRARQTRHKRGSSGSVDGWPLGPAETGGEAGL